MSRSIQEEILVTLSILCYQNKITWLMWITLIFAMTAFVTANLCVINDYIKKKQNEAIEASKKSEPRDAS